MSARMHQRVFSSALSLVLACGMVAAARAGVVLDGSMGTAGAIAGPDYAITSGMGTLKGTNLFHSFSTFDLVKGESATFSSVDPVSNVIARVTGGNASSIDGTLRCSVPGAALYLINPSGVVFGADATLDVGGSFHASTAHYLELQDGSRFYTGLSRSSVLSTAPPAAFGFLSGSANEIVVDGSYLKVPDGETISLVGGNLRIKDGNLVAPGGTVNLVSAASAGTASFDGSVFNVDSFSKFGSVEIANSQGYSYPHDHGFNADPAGNVDTCGSGGGKVFIRSGKFVLDNARVDSISFGDRDGQGIDVVVTSNINLSNNAEMCSSTNASGKAGGVSVETGSLAISGGTRMTTVAYTGSTGDAGAISVKADTIRISGYHDDEGALQRSSISSDSYGDGDAGSISIDTGKLAVSGGGAVSSSVRSGTGGKGGDMTIKATEISISGSYSSEKAVKDGVYSYIANFTSGHGDAGTLSIIAGSLSIARGGYVSTEALKGSSGRGGDMIIKADDVTVSGSYSNAYEFEFGVPGYIVSSSYGSGDAGNIAIEARSLTLVDAGYLLTSTGSGSSGHGGNITIKAEHVEVSGYDFSWDESQQASVYALSSIKSNTFGKGDAGNISLETDGLLLSGGGQIDASTWYDDTGNAGNISITAGVVTIEGRAILFPSAVKAQSYGDGHAGVISVEANELLITDGGGISTYSQDDSNAGTISIKADKIALFGKRSSISSTAGSSGINRNSAGYTSRSGSASGGNITVASNSLVMSEGATISCANNGYGAAGSILISSSDQIALSSSSISCSTPFGDGGNISINKTGYLFLDGSAVSAAVEGTLGEGGTGNGGNIDITADNFYKTDDSTIHADSNLGMQGTVEMTITPLRADIVSKLTALDEQFQDPDKLAPKPCAESERELSTFVVKGRDGLPPSPGTYLSGM